MNARSARLFAAALVGCSQGGSAAPHATTNEGAHASSKSSLEVEAEGGASAAREGRADARGAPDASSPWTRFARRDDTPLCAFASYDGWGKAQLLAEVPGQAALKAGEELYFGAYAPGCAARDCLREVTLQCWADVEGSTITLHTRFSGEHNPENTCVKDCEPATAACNTPALKAGTYTLVYGEKQRTLRIPGTLRPTCL